MKCRVCGYEVEEGASHCPMCGTRVVSAADKPAEISWNTKDFPKPKEMEDIEMSWPDLNSFGHATQVSEEKIEEALDKKEPLTVMSEDASEGYVSRPTPAEENPPVKPFVPPMSKATMEVRTSNVPPEAKPKDEPALPAYWYTQKFTATGIMQTGPAWPVAPGSTNPNFPTTATIETMTLSDPVPIAPLAQDGSSAPGFTLEDILEEFGVPVKKPSDPSAVHTFVNTKAQDTAPSAPVVPPVPPVQPSPVDTLQQKNEEFQRLLDREYDRLRVLHGGEEPEGFPKSARFVPEEKVQAKDLSTFEKMLMQTEEAPAEKTPAQKFFTDPTEEEKNTGDPELAAFIEPAGDPSKYDIDTIENTIRKLQEQEIIDENRRNERKKRLFAMTAAREAYYASLDKEAGKDAEVTAPAEEPAFEDVSVEDASPLDLGEDDEPTKEIPVGSILKALAAGGAVAAVEKSMEAAATTAKAAAETAETIEAAEKPAVKTAALAATSLASISEDAGWTRVFRRSLTEEAEERAKIYEERASEAAEDAQHPVDAAEEIAKKYEAAFGHPAKEDDTERKSWTIADPSVFAGIKEPSEEPSEDDIAAAEARVAEALGAAPETETPAEPVQESEEAAETPAEPVTEPAAEAEEVPAVPAAEPAEVPAEPAEEAEVSEEPAQEQVQPTEPETTIQDAAEEAQSIDAKLAEAEKAMEAKLAEADAIGSKAETGDQPAEEPQPAEKPVIGADTADAQARIAAALAALSAGAAETKPAEAEETEERPAEDADTKPAEGEDTETPSEAEPAVEEPSEAENKDDILSSAFSESKGTSEPTHEIDLEEVRQEEKDEDDDDDGVGDARSRHIVLKIIAIILVICALFEGVVMGLKYYAPESQITQNAVQIEQGVGDALVSLYNTIADGVRNLFGGN